MVPALRAARQMVRAFSRAILWPCWGIAWPIAESLTETSAHLVRPRTERAPSSVEVGLDGRVRLVGVEGVLAEVVEGDPEVLVDQACRRVHGVRGVLAGDVAADDPRRDRHGADQALDPAAAREQQQRLAEERHADRLLREPGSVGPPLGVRGRGSRG